MVVPPTQSSDSSITCASVSAERSAKMLQPEDVADMVVAIAKLPPRAHVPEITIKPTNQDFA